MATPQIKEDFFGYDVPHKVEYARDRIQDSNGNAVLTTPDPPLNDLTTVTDALEQAYNDAQGGSDNQKEALVAAEQNWDKKFHRFVKYCNLACDGDTVKISSIGFSWTDTDQTKRLVPPKVEGLKAAYVNSQGTAEAGVIYVSNNVMEKDLVDSFVTIASTKSDIDQIITVQDNQLMIPAISEPIVIAHSTSSKKALKMRLTPGLRWHLVRYAVNSTGKGPNSDKVSIIAPGN